MVKNLETSSDILHMEVSTQDENATSRAKVTKSKGNTILTKNAIRDVSNVITSSNIEHIKGKPNVPSKTKSKITGFQAEKEKKVVRKKVVPKKKDDELDTVISSSLDAIVEEISDVEILDPMEVDLQVLELEKEKEQAAIKRRLRNQVIKIENIDEHDVGDPQFCSEYVPYIFSYLKQKEITEQICSSYMTLQPEITDKHRMILIDWISEVSIKFRLTIETLFIAVGILDRYLQVKPVIKSKLQLVGIGSLLIAAKYEEICTPEINDFVWITAGAYNKQDLLEMEREILTIVNFNLSFPVALTFLRRYSKAARSDSLHHTLSKYIIELSLMDYGMLRYFPSQIAASAVYIARAMCGDSPRWNSTIDHYTGYSDSDIRACASDLNEILRKQSNSRYQSMFTKYSSPLYSQVACIPTLSEL